MAGLICGFFGYQRSGKTLMAYLLATSFNKIGMNVYTNMNVSGWITIKSLNDIPLDYKPKVLLLDECYYFLDSRNWSNNTSASIFMNTIGKQSILLLYTSITPEMIDKRLREQSNYIFMAKKSETYISYKMFDCIRQKSRLFKIDTVNFDWSQVKYNTLEVPDYIEVQFKNFNKTRVGKLVGEH